jgi:hypothetical protein
MSPIVDQTIRCINGENTLLKRTFRVPNPRRTVTASKLTWLFVRQTNNIVPLNLESLSTDMPEQVHQIFVRASDVNIVCEVEPVPVHQPCDMLVKVRTNMFDLLETTYRTCIYSRQPVRMRRLSIAFLSSCMPMDFFIGQ